MLDMTAKAIELAVEQISTGVQIKVAQIEEQRNREFTHQLKELEFYKVHYQNEIKQVFDYWFEVVRLTWVSTNQLMCEEEKNENACRLNELLTMNTMSQYQMNTIKYGGVEAPKALVMTKRINKIEAGNKMLGLLTWASVLSALKKDILGQNLDPIDVLRMQLNDFDENVVEMKKAIKIYCKEYKRIYNENPYWK